VPLGLYVSRCGGRVSDAIDIEQAVENARSQTAVLRVVDDLFDPAVQDLMARDVADAGLDAIVLAGHSLNHYRRSLSGQYLKDRLVDAGVNPNRVVAANLLEQVALVHPDDRRGATTKARALIDVAVLRATLSDEQEGIETQPRASVLILGATSEGLVAAQRLLQLGFAVVIADRADGATKLRESDDMRATVSFVTSHPDSQFVEGVSIADGQGWLGDYEIAMETGAGRVTHRVGGILLASPEETDWVTELRQHFRVDVDDDGMARSLHPATHPAETVDPGIMTVPSREGNGQMRDRVAAADSAAIALVLKLSQPKTVHYRDTSIVDESLCGGCATCVRTCAFGACYIGEDGLSHVDVRRCRGCGKCVVSCPVGARDIVNSPHDYVIGAIRTLAETKFDGEDEKVLGFLCGGCGYPAADSASEAVGNGTGSYPASFLPLRIPCGGRLDTLYVLEAFKAGFDGVAVFRCKEGHCHNLIGNLDMDRRVNLLRTVLRSRWVDDSRLRIVDISPFEGERFVNQVVELNETIRTLDNGKGGPQ